MLILKGLHWSNVFSYGEDNYISLNSSRLTQLVGLNGTGKSSIPLILQEVLFNKNSKGIKKAGIENRNTSKKGYDIAVEFELDNSEYFFRIERKGASTKTELLKDGEEIGAHTASATYKQVAELIGMDFNTFCQLVYQSVKSSLEFLTATDTQRKKFLISLLNLSEYTEKEFLVKRVFSEVNVELTKVQSSVETIQAWLDSNNSFDTEKRELVEIPEDPKNLREVKVELSHEQSNAKSLNNKIQQNNRTKSKVDQLEATIAIGKPIAPEYILGELKETQGKIKNIRDTATSTIKKLKALDGKCPSCMSLINKSSVIKLIDEQIEVKDKCDDKLGIFLDRLQETEIRLGDESSYNSSLRSLERLKDNLDEDLPEDLVDATQLQIQIALLDTDIANMLTSIKKATRENTAAETHNAKIDLILEQSTKYQTELISKSAKLSKLQQRLVRLGVLKRAFGTKGLVAYKIESMIKDLEVLINEYLIELSDGRFGIIFQVKGDKLDVVILDEGAEVDMNSLSSGEEARVNVATLLAIRKLMNTLSTTKLNLLILDEVTSVLDEEGREKLVEVLNKEQDINAFIVSHGWHHPLVNKIDVTNTDKISRIEY